MRPLLVSLVVVFSACSKPGGLARLDEGGGIARGSRVFAEGVNVGTVDRVEVVEGRVHVSYKWSEGASASLRVDACATVLPGEPASLLLLPGKDLVALSGPLTPCREDDALRARMKSLASSGSATLALGAKTWLAAHPLNEPLREPCDALEVSRVRVEAVDAVPVLLPTGGRRVWLTLENRSDLPLSLSTARFIDSRGVEARHAHLPEDDALFVSLALPPRTRREVSAVFEDSREVSAVEFEAVTPSAPGESCRSRWPF